MMSTLEARYVVIPQENTVEIKSEPLDTTLAPDALLIQSEATMISAGTELANFTGADPGVHQPGSYNTYPYRPGYGNIGRVVAVGSKVRAFAAGERVFSFAKHASHVILNPVEQPVWQGVFEIDREWPVAELAVLRMALIALTAPQLTPVEPGDTVAVFGLGLVGNLAAQLYQLAGAGVIGLDPLPERCALAQQVGIQTTVSAQPAEQVTAIRDMTGGKGAHITIEAAGHAASAVNAIEACADFGQVVLLGSPRTPYAADLTDTLRHIHLRWLTVRGALEWCIPPQSVWGKKHSIAGNLSRLLTLMRSGQLQLRPLVSHAIRPDQLADAYRGLLNDKQHYWGVVIDWR